MNNEISFQIELTDDFDSAVEKVTAALKDQGFGVLTEIDVKATLKQKIDQDFRPYKILGACNPPLAHKALESEPLVGLMLPCNVTVEAADNGSIINLVNPKTMLLSYSQFKDNPTLKEVADDAYTRLAKVAEVLTKG